MNDIDFFESDSEIEDNERFVINTPDLAEWAMRKIIRAESELELIEKSAQNMIDEINRRKEILMKPHNQTIENMKMLLEPYIGMKIAEQGKKKSYDLIGGRAGYRTSPSHVEIIDETWALKWLKSHNYHNCIVTKQSISKTAVNELIKETGEIPEGIEIKSGDTKFYVETNQKLIGDKKV